MIKFTQCAKTNKNVAVNVSVSPLVIKLRMIQLFVFVDVVLDCFNGSKYYLGKVKSQDNAGQWLSDLSGLGQLCKFSWGTLQFINPVACLHLFTTLQPFA